MEVRARDARLQQRWRSLRRSRLAANLPRHLATATLLAFFALGVRAAFFAPDSGAPNPSAPASADAPSRAYALQFARAYLSYDAGRPGWRVRALAPYLGEGLRSDGGLYPQAGSQRVEWVELASDQPALAGGRTLTVGAGVDTQPLPLYLAVTVRHRGDGPVEIVGYPALVGAPALAASGPGPARETIEDAGVLAVIDRVLRNYLTGSGRDLRADLDPEAEVTLPTRALRLDSIEEAAWLGEPGSGAALVTVSARDPGTATYTLTYELGIAYRERPYVTYVQVIPTRS